MSSCSPFGVPFSGSAQDLYDKLVALIHQAGGTITGDASSGSFDLPVPPLGHAKGTYTISGQTLTIHVTSKSILLSCSAIAKYVKDHLPRVEETDIADF